jgi:hypothetical protein
MRIIEKIRGLVVLCLVVVSFTSVVPFGTTAEAAAPPELYKVGSAVVTGDPNDPFQWVTANCRPFDVVVGGGARVVDPSRRVRLTHLVPREPAGDDNFGHFLAAAEAPVGFTGTWTLQAFAICAPQYQVPGYQIVGRSAWTQTDSPFLQVTESCPDDQLVIGTGAAVYESDRHVGLQLNRSSGPMDISRATAREDDGYEPGWALGSFAICVDNTPSRRVPGQHVVASLHDGPYGETICTNAEGRPTFVHSVGGGGGTIDSGRAWLQVLEPFDRLKKVRVRLTAPTDAGGVAVYAICAW